MRILFCCEYYSPSVGGVQEVMKQLAERLVSRGHHVCVATTRLSDRPYSELNGVTIKEFSITGNLVRGMRGEIAEYQRFVTTGHFDVVMIKAAQQWAFDALWPVLDRIRYAKVFIPCGFSCFHEPAYGQYFRELPRILIKFDHLIFYASDYRDINYVKQHGLRQFTIIPNGASEVEFGSVMPEGFRERYGIGTDEFLMLTVGNPPVQKGQVEVAKAFRLADFGGRAATLILNGNWFGDNKSRTGPQYRKREMIQTVVAKLISDMFRLINRDLDLYREHGLVRVLKNTLKPIIVRIGFGSLLARLGYRVEPRKRESNNVYEVITNAFREEDNKRILILNLPRSELVKAFGAADLFIFASQVEYSPLVLYEAVAAGTPFLSVPVGNAREIAEQTGGGVLCPADQDERGYTRVNPAVLGEHISTLARNPDLLERLGSTGRKNWQAKFTWDKITDQYEVVLTQCGQKRGAEFYDDHHKEHV